jgi:uncharacterized membrane protein
MLMQNLALLIAIALPAVIVIVLRSDAAVVFLSLCAGSLLVHYAGNDAGLVGSAIGNNSAVTGQYFQLGLLLVPTALSAVMLKKSMRGGKVVLNVLPAIAVGLVGVLLAVPLLPNGISDAITKTSGWSMLHGNQELVVAASVLVSLVSLWVAHLGSGKKPKHHK